MGAVQAVQDGKFVESQTAASLAKENIKKANSGMDKDAFLQLLVAQMKYQDPLEPTSNTEYISQFATFSSLEQMQNMSATLELSRASSLVGQTVLMKVTDSTGKTTQVQGNVDFVVYENNKAYLSIAGELYSMDDLDKVADKKYLEGYAKAADFLNIYKKLPEIGMLSIADRDNVEKLEEILNSMDEYQLSFLTDDYIEGAKTYIQRMKDIIPNEDGNDPDDDSGEGSDTK
ncbi:MAG: flagellar hook capping protein [Lachnospiraceae bacterium]|nr:flagellar hook capping protein [Lachnospiraceae bacterium]